MSCDCCEEFRTLSLGDVVPDFTLKTFDPAKGDFGEFSLGKAKAAKRWSILFFYPADFTFV
jgi:peroxiredoxin (alkyl hydroperoxide reductase subunit C)